MDKIAIVTDRACDLPQALVERYGIHLVSLVVRFGTEVHLDDGQLTADEFWKKAEETSLHPETSQPSAGMFEQAFAPLVERDYHVLCLVITSKHSGTYNSAHAAAQSFPGQVTVFDTLSLSLAQGCQVIVAARAAAEGRPVEEIVAMLESIRSRTHMFIAFDTIEYLRRGGRFARLMPVLDRAARALSLKPIIIVRDGELRLFGVARSLKKAMARIQQEIVRRAPAEMLVAVHTRRADEVEPFARALAELIDFPFEQVMIAEAGPALSSHAGPGVIGAAIVQRTG